MERKNPPRESPRRLSAKPGKGAEAKKGARRLGTAAAESDKDSGFSGQLFSTLPRSLDRASDSFPASHVEELYEALCPTDTGSGKTDRTGCAPGSDPDGGSECLSSAERMDSEDVPSASGWSRLDRPGRSSKTAGGAFSTLSPMVVMKNVLVRQGGGSSQLQSWTVQPSFEVISAQPPLLLLRPSVPSPVRPCHAGEKKSDSRNYLPILNSYTKIAPHPGKRGLSLSPKERERGTQKKICTERPGPSSPASEPTRTGAVSCSPPPAAPPGTKLAEDAALQGVPSLAAGGSPQTLQPVSSSHVAKAPSLTFASPASPVCASDSTPPGLESNSPLSPLPANYGSPLWAAEHLCRSPDIFAEQRQSKHRRFQNTLVVLHKSGLLEITLKTKELIRQNQATQVELDQLKEQTQLLVEAIKGRAPQAWAKLQASLTSGSSHTGSDLDAFSDHPDI